MTASRLPLTDPRSVRTCCQIGAAWLLLARVSTASRKELIEHVDTAVAAHSGCAHVSAIHKLVTTRPELLEKGPAGVRTRSAVGWTTVYAPGTLRELGVLAQQGHVRVLFLNASAAALDLGDDNAFLEIMKMHLADAWFQGKDPHAPAAERPKLLAPFFDRLMRELELSLVLFRHLQGSYAIVNVEGAVEIDSLAEGADDAWMLQAWQSSKQRKTGSKRLATGSLNLWRLGRYAASEQQLLRGFRFQHEALPDGTWRRSSDVHYSAAGCESLLEHVVEPDPESWWEVQTLIDCALDDNVTTWAGLTVALGKAGLCTRDSRGRGTPLHRVSDKASAAQTAIDLSKLDAYERGSYSYGQTGPGHGTWVLPGGHRFEPRYDGDDRGSLTYTVDVGVPEWRDDDFAKRVQRVRAKWWPEGEAKKARPGVAGRDEESRPLSGLLAWSEEGAKNARRYEVLFHSGRYELRSQQLDVAPRIKSGALQDLRHDNSDLELSWEEAELTGHVADLIDEATRTLLRQRPDADFPSHITVRRPTRTPWPVSPRMAQRRELTERITRLERQAAGANAASNDMYALGDNEQGRAKLVEASEHRHAAAAARVELDALDATQPDEPEPAPPVVDEPALLDFGQPAVVVAALRSGYGRGRVPPPLKQRVATMLNGTGRLAPTTDGLLAELSASVRFTLSDGTEVDVAVCRTVPARHSQRLNGDRTFAAARLYMHAGLSLEATAAAARWEDQTGLLRLFRETLRDTGAWPCTPSGEGRPQPLKDGLLAAALQAAVPEPRQIAWSVLYGEPAPAGLPRGFAAHFRHTYFPSGTGEERPWPHRWALGDTERLRAVAVLDSHPALRLGMQVDHLSACVGSTDDRSLLRMSTLSATHTGLMYPTLSRVHDWRGRQAALLDPADKLLAPVHCTHQGCSGWATAVLDAPEVHATGSAVLCTTCRRSPTSGQRFPASYIAHAHDRLSAHTGEWMPCARSGCQVDFGVGPGLMWRWTGDTGDVWHGPDCAAGREPVVGPRLRLRRCSDTECSFDEGHGPGIIGNTGRGNRAWHNDGCINAGRRAAASPLPSKACHYRDCATDEGAGAGQLIIGGGKKASRNWHDRTCQAAQRRLELGLPASGTETWAQCERTGCTTDEGGGPGFVRSVSGQVGRPRRFHDARCGRAARRA